MMDIKMTTDRLDLIAGTVELAQAETSSRTEFSRLLQAGVPEHWPPPPDNAETLMLNRRSLEDAPDQAGWWNWYVVLSENETGGRFLIGSVGFSGPPTSEGVVEIGYAMLKEAHGRGYATEAVEGLLTWAFAHTTVERVVAQTFLGLAPSLRVIEKSGFVATEVTEDGVIRFELSRATFGPS
jgi:RimJ/RimL family protein N-acetyltransferase